jgi:hypothetical protein
LLVGGSFAKRSSTLLGVWSDSNRWGIEMGRLPHLTIKFPIKTSILSWFGRIVYGLSANRKLSINGVRGDTNAATSDEAALPTTGLMGREPERYLYDGALVRHMN